jgi:hypothetical protein
MGGPDIEKAQRAVHEALKEFLDEGEIPICWCLVIDIAGPEDIRYLAHRSGGGADGADSPMTWTALGMIRSSVLWAEQQTIEITLEHENFEDEDNEDDEDE